jgi:hypothetical protein
MYKKRCSDPKGAHCTPYEIHAKCDADLCHFRVSSSLAEVPEVAVGIIAMRVNQTPASRGGFRDNNENCTFESFSIAEIIHYG